MPCLLTALFISAIHASEVFVVVFLQGACTPCLLITIFISTVYASDVFVVFFARGMHALYFNCGIYFNYLCE